MKYFYSILLILMMASQCAAATLEFASKENTISVGEIIEISIVLDPENQELNAVEGEIVFPSSLSVVDTSDGNSIVSLWTERPDQRAANTIMFSGIMPGGFKGLLSPYYTDARPGKLFTVRFRGEQEGVGIIRVGQARVFLNNGTGEDLSVTGSETTVTVRGIGTRAELVFNDVISPEEFTPTVGYDEAFFGGKQFIAFAAHDKGSGIAYYEVREGAGPWQRRESPWVVSGEDEALAVKAVDKAGNERVVDVVITYPPPQRINFGILILCVVVGILLLGWRLRA